ncbi:hypothetical protein L2K70_13730 [Nocardioides KLBMP 9356]|uniref:Uncharacterized protein n=1 Tax=Nocardioides potassii TaxID=2911371 RepID=A0ABS9HF18_9ACTN|nr:hypothetical protein [Nocardioides potassii]MCF6378668.1 hypothetical protein [Nocardioides potassii]
MTLRARWSVVPAVVGCVLAIVATVTSCGTGGSDDPSTTPRSTACVSEATAPAEQIGEQVAEWVRFCPLAEEGAAERVRHPAGVVTGDLAAAVAATLWQTQDGRPQCGDEGGRTSGPNRRFRIEVGLGDGRVAELAGSTGCSTRDATLFSQLETTLLMDAAGAAPAAAPRDPISCPGRFTTTLTDADGASAAQLVDGAEHPWQSTVPVLPMPAVVADVCAYSGDGRRRTLVDQWRTDPATADAIRAQATTGYTDGVADCEPDPGATSYVVVLGDRTGTTRTLAIDPTRCATVQAAIGTPPVDTYLGLASPRLVRVVSRSRP